MDGMVYWITGLSGAGKTTIGTRLYYKLKARGENAVLLDGDVIKGLFSRDNVDYSVPGRKKRAYQYSELCRLLAVQGVTVICCTIAMYHEVRDWNRQNIPNYREIYIDVDLETISKRDSKGLYGKYNAGVNAMVGVDSKAELPKNPDMIIKNTMQNNADSYADDIIARFISNGKGDNYWNGYYSSGNAPQPPSDFAQFAFTYMQAGKKLIDLGCGNGRDSVFFADSGLKVTAVDSSSDAIDSINARKKPIFAVCDDFVTAKALFCVDYDYCYARWSIHAITKAQQDELLPSVFDALKKDGLFFIEARTVNDFKFGKGDKLGDDEFFLDDHYRRFLRSEQLKLQLEGIGFELVYFEESDSFSVVDGDSPTLIRIIARK